MSVRICCKQCVVSGLGLVLTVVGMVFYLNWINWFTILRGREIALSPTSQTYSGWKTSPVLNLDVYLFNWTNPHEFTNHSVKPHFQELGPYRFKDAQDKVDIDFHPHNHSVTFRKKSIFHFDPEGSVGNLSDVITTINMVAWSAVHRKRNSGFFERQSLKALLSLYNEELTVTKTADELLFAGYEDRLVELGSAILMFTDNIPYDRVGYFYMRNGSTNFNGLLNMFTGTDDFNKFGRIHTWNRKTHNGFFESHCGMVNGSMGEFFPSNLKEEGYVEMYIPNICRTIPLDYTESVDIYGVKGLKFAGTRRSVDNGTMYPETKCFCVNGKCERAGVMNLGPCQFGTTTFMSYPHFYAADPYYVEQIDGMKPEKEKHEFFMTLEPHSGFPMDVGGGFQANVLIERIPNMGIYDKVPRVFLPLMWCEQRFRVAPEIIAKMNMIPLLAYWGQVAASVVTLLGIVLFFWYPVHWIKLQFIPKDQRKRAIQKTYELKAVKTESKPFMEKNIGTIIIKPQKLSLLGDTSNTTQR